MTEPFMPVMGTATAVPKDANKDEIERLASQGEDYKNSIDEWMFFLESYEGGRSYINSDNIHRHNREVDDDYKERLKRARYDNFCQPLTDFVPEYIFSQGIDRQPNGEVSSDFAVFQADCDRKGTPLNRFMQEVAENIRIFGMTHVLVDSPRVSKPVDQISVEDAQRENLRPYVVQITPLELIDWTKDELGNFTYAKRECMISERQADRSVREIAAYTEWDKDAVELSFVDVTDQNEKKLLTARNVKLPNAFGMVPIRTVTLKRKKSRRNVGQSFLSDIAYQNRTVANISSLIDEFLGRQCFNVLMIPENSSLPKRTQIDGVIGSSNVLTFPKEASHIPSYLVPPSDPAEFMQAERDKAIAHMYRHAAQDIMTDLFGKDASGDAEKQRFSRTIPVINRTADCLEEAEHSILKLWAKSLRKEWKGKISYKDDYSVTNVADLVLQLSQIFSTVKVMSPTFWREQWKRLVRELDGKIDGTQLEKIYQELDEYSDDDILAMLEGPAEDMQAALGMPSTGNLIQGEKEKAAGNDKNVALGGNAGAANKEAAPDSNKRATNGRSRKRPDRRATSSR